LVLVVLLFWPGFLIKRVANPKEFLIAIYFIECVAMVMGMGIPVFSVILAFVWGIVFGLRFRISASKHNALTLFFFSGGFIYFCSFCLLGERMECLKH